MKRLFLRQKRLSEVVLKHKRGQATTELAVMGAVVLMLLAYLLQQGYFYNVRQALEMYAFRETLKLSRAQERGISLTVSRDVITPSFFSRLSRQRMMASASVEVNPWKVYVPEEDDPEDIGTYQLLQIDEAMIRDSKFIMVPPTKVKIDSDDSEEAKWQWMNSSIREIDPQIPPEGVEEATPFANTSNYTYLTSISEDRENKTITKNLASHDIIERGITFEDKDKIIEDYNLNTTDSHMDDLEEETIPKPIKFTLSEDVHRQKTLITPHNLGGEDGAE